MTVASDDWPSHTAELNRKTTDTLNAWVRRFDAGKITRRELFVLVSGLYDATSGLVAKEISDMMADIHAELRKPSADPAAQSVAA
jgi:hypothetical protein